MTVKELIAKLILLDQDAFVLVPDYDGANESVSRVEPCKDERCFYSRWSGVMITTSNTVEILG